MTVEELWQQGWLGVVVTVVGGLVLAALLSTISQTARAKFWRPMRARLGSGLRWLHDLEFKVSTARQRKATAAATQRLERDSRRFKEVCDLLDVRPVREDSTVIAERITQLREAKDKAWAHAQKEIDATKSLAQRELAQQARRGAELAETARELGRQTGYAAAMAEVEAQRAAPQLQPQWRIDTTDDSTQFVLRNTQPGVAVSDVSLTPPMSDFAFTSPSQWPGPADSAIAFGGERQGNGRPFGVRFVVRWRDENGDHKGGEVFLDKEPRPPIVSAHSRVARLPPEPTNWT